MIIACVSTLHYLVVMNFKSLLHLPKVNAVRSIGLGFISLVLSASACSNETAGNFSQDSELDGSTPISLEAFQSLEAFYAVSGDATDIIGTILTTHSSQSYDEALTPTARLSFFATANSVFLVGNWGCVSNIPIFEGQWHQANNTLQGRIRLQFDTSSSDAGDSSTDAGTGSAIAAKICAGTALTTSELETVKMSGYLGYSSDDLTIAVSIAFSAVYAQTKSHVQALAHRGGCATSDSCGASENSIEMLGMSEALGASGAEVNVLSTADHIPILHHGSALVPRLDSGYFCMGEIPDMTYSLLNAACRLHYGEQIPTLEQALQFVDQRTRLQVLWLDIKDTGTLNDIAPILANFTSTRPAGEELEVLLGITDSETYAAYQALPVSQQLPCLLELDEATFNNSTCKVWAPRYAAGLLADAITQVQTDGNRVFQWWVNRSELIDYYITGSSPDGLLSDRPFVVFDRLRRLELDEEGEEAP